MGGAARAYEDRRGDHGGELPRVGLDEETVPIEQGVPHAVAGQQAMLELVEYVDVAPKCGEVLADGLFADGAKVCEARQFTTSFIAS